MWQGVRRERVALWAAARGSAHLLKACESRVVGDGWAVEIEVVPLAIDDRLHAEDWRVIELERDDVGLVRLAPEVDTGQGDALGAAQVDAVDQPVSRVGEEGGECPLPPGGPVEQQQEEPEDEEMVRVPERLVVPPADGLVRAGVDDDHADGQ